MVLRGHHVTVFAGERNGRHRRRDDDCGVIVERLPFATRSGIAVFTNARVLWRAVGEVHRNCPLDVIEGPELTFGLAPRSLRVTTAIRMHGGHRFFASTLGARPRRLRSALERRSFGRAAHISAVSRFVAATTMGLLGTPDRPFELLPNPVDTEVFTPIAGAEEDRLIVFAGTLCEKKGIRQLVQAMPSISAAMPGARLVAAGRDSRDPKGSFRAQLEELMVPEMRRHVEFVGHIDRDEMPALLSKASVCVYPSHMEACPVAWLEGLAMGKAVIASQAGPGPEIVEHGRSGLLCNPRDPQSIASQVIAALSDRALRARLGAEARRDAVERFSIDALLPRNEAYFEGCGAAREDTAGGGEQTG